MDAFTFLARVLVAAGVLSLLEGLYSVKSGADFVRLFRRRGVLPPPGFAPPATLILPCKGVDAGLEDNLEAFLGLDYPDFQILFVTDRPSDPSVPVIEKVRLRHTRVPTKLLYAGIAEGRGQKVHNLLYALGFLRGRDEVLAFGDSDIRPRPEWLRHLVGGLQDPEAGVSTGFRWYLPQDGGFASVLRSVWNAGVFTVMRERGAFFAWGGAMAIRRRTFEACRVTDSWRGALSDDYSLSHAVRKLGLSIHFQPHCLSFSHEDCSIGQLWEWSCRQMTITRVYFPLFWKLALVSQSLHCTALWGGVAYLLAALWTGHCNRCLTVGALAVSIYLLGVFKSGLRLRALAILFPEEAAQVRRYRLAYLFWGPLAAVLSLAGLVRTLFTREIEWRGVRYRMLSPEETLVLPATERRRAVI